MNTSNQPLTRPSATLSPSDGERDGVRGARETPQNRMNTIANHGEPTLVGSLRALPRAAWVLFAGTFINRFGGFVVPFLTLYLTGQGYSVTAAGLAVSAYGVGNLFALLVGGHLADRLGRRETIVLSMFCAAAVMLLLS